MKIKLCVCCKRFRRPGQLWPARSGIIMCYDCADKFDGCEICGSTAFENMTRQGQLHFEDDCFK